MKRIIIMMLAALCCMVASAQRIVTPTVTHTKTLKTTDLGNQKLEVAITDGDTIYCATLATGYSRRVVVELGNTDKALGLLQFLYDYEPKRGDIIDLENATHNMARWQGINGYLIYSEGKQFSGHLRKPNIKGFIASIKDFAGKE